MAIRSELLNPQAFNLRIMEQVLIGKILTQPSHRDAIHIAILPAKATQSLQPGQAVLVGKHGAEPATSNAIGIVDPFLEKEILAGQEFYIFMKPNTITSLRHMWTHSKVEDETTVDSTKITEAIKEIQKLADEADLGYNAVLRAAFDYLDNDDYLYDGMRYDGIYASDKFWNAFEIVTGRKVDSGDRGSFFSCSC
jgi:hypothetical protein